MVGPLSVPAFPEGAAPRAAAVPKSNSVMMHKRLAVGRCRAGATVQGAVSRGPKANAERANRGGGVG